MTVTLLSGTRRFGSAGSSLLDAVTSAIDSSRVIATLWGGPTTLVGAWTSPTTFGGLTLRSRTVIVSGTGLSEPTVVLLTSAVWPSLAETASCAPAAFDKSSGVDDATGGRGLPNA